MATNLERWLTDLRFPSSFVLYRNVHLLFMIDALGGRVDRDMTSQHPSDRSLPISTSQAFIQSATSGVARASL